MSKHCGNCEYFSPTMSDRSFGQCFRYASKPYTFSVLEVEHAKEADEHRMLANWPEVAKGDFCGEWEIDPELLPD